MDKYCRTRIWIDTILMILVVLGLVLAIGGLHAHAMSNSQTTVLSGQVTVGIDTLKYATVKITLVGPQRYYTSTDLVPSVTIATKADANGNWSYRIIGTDSLHCGTCDIAATYNVVIEHPTLSNSGQKIEYNGLTIPANNGGTTQLRTIIAGM
jgi:hypothetical protein